MRDMVVMEIGQRESFLELRKVRRKERASFHSFDLNKYIL